MKTKPRQQRRPTGEQSSRERANRSAPSRERRSGDERAGERFGRKKPVGERNGREGSLRKQPAWKRERRGENAETPEKLLVAGRKPVFEILRHSPKQVERIYLLDRLDGEQLPPVLQKALHAFSSKLSRVPLEKLESLRVSHHQGIVAEIRAKELVGLSTIIETAKTNPKRAIVILDQVTDPQNVGSILRVAEAFNCAGIVLTERRSASMTATVNRVSAGASALVDVCIVKNLQRALDELKKSGIWVVGTALGQKSNSLFSTSLKFPVALVFGAEGEGMRRLTQESCDELVEIPMSGKIQSLNVNQAASILLYEAARKATDRK